MNCSRSMDVRRAREQILWMVVVRRKEELQILPQKVRTEDSGERRRTSNCPMRVPAELRSWNRRNRTFFTV